MRKLNAKFDAVIVKPLETEETMYGSIVVPDAGKDRNEQGEVVSVGPGKHTVTGEFIPTETKIGDIVVLPTMGFTKFQFNGDEFYVGSEQQILATITTNENE
jgi:chaperonin GroES